MFQAKLQRKLKNTFYIQQTFFSRNLLCIDNVGKYEGNRQPTGDNKIRRMCVVCWITGPTDIRLRICNTVFSLRGSHYISSYLKRLSH